MTRSGQAKIDRDDVAGHQVLAAVERNQPVERSCDISLRQQHVDAVLQSQVPAPLADQHRRAHEVAQRGMAIERGEKLLGPRLRSASDYERQTGASGGAT